MDNSLYGYYINSQGTINHTVWFSPFKTAFNKVSTAMVKLNGETVEFEWNTQDLTAFKGTGIWTQVWLQSLDSWTFLKMFGCSKQETCFWWKGDNDTLVWRQKGPEGLERKREAGWFLDVLSGEKLRGI